MSQGSRLTAKIPSAVLAIITGTAAYYAMASLGMGPQLTDVVGAIPSTIPAPHFADDLLDVITSPETFSLLLPLLPTALALAVLNTLQTLIAVVTADNLMETRSQSNRELIGQGISNFVSGTFGGMAASGAMGGTLTNYGNGGRGVLSRFAASGLALAVILFLGPFISNLPKIVLAGCLLALALSIFDRPGLQLLSDAVQRKVNPREAIKDLSIIATVMIILLVFGPLAAVGAGVLVALAHFILSMAHDNVRREFTGESIRSHVHRNDAENGALAALGQQVRIIELEGPLFFGTSDRLTTKLEELSNEDVSFILLDFKRTSEIDTTAVSLLCQARNACMKNGSKLVLCSLEDKPTIARFLKSSKLYDEFDSNEIHATSDDGLAYIEDLLLDGEFGTGRYAVDLAPKDISVLSALDAQALERLTPYLETQVFRHGDAVIRQGASADAIYFIQRGQADIEVTFGDGIARNLGILCPGAVFGEMAVLDGNPRSATIVADGELACLRLSVSSLEELGSKFPEVRHALMAAIGLELSKRIRISNQALSALKA